MQTTVHPETATRSTEAEEITVTTTTSSGNTATTVTRKVRT